MKERLLSRLPHSVPTWDINYPSVRGRPLEDHYRPVGLAAVAAACELRAAPATRRQSVDARGRDNPASRTRS
jgi:hypothetical protein